MAGRAGDVVQERAVSPVIYIVFCLALPWIWGAVIAAIYARQARRRVAAKGDRPPTDYSI